MLVKYEMKRMFLGYKSKKLDNYKKEVDRIHTCMVCGDEIAESGSYGELGHIVRRKFEVRPGWYYQFTKLCPNCFGEVNAVLRRIRKERKREEKDGP